MLAMLLVIGMLIFQSRDASMWKWLDKEPDENADDVAVVKKNPIRPVAAKVQTESTPPNAATLPSETIVPAETKTANPSPEQKHPETNPDEPAWIIAGTDLDPDEWKEAQEDFAPIKDLTVNLAPIEMKSYWKVLHWVELQSLDILKARTKGQKPPPFRELTSVSGAETNRGKLFKVALNVRQLLPFAVPKENVLGVDHLYELVGTNEKSGDWIWYGITDQIPEGMKTGSDLHQKVTFYGYFYKVQGYKPQQAHPNSKPVPAPLLMGRMEWHRPIPLPPPANPANELYIAAGVVVVLLLALLLYKIIKPTNQPYHRPGVPTADASEAGFANWLQHRPGEDIAPPSQESQPILDDSSPYYPHLS